MCAGVLVHVCCVADSLLRSSYAHNYLEVWNFPEFLPKELLC